MADFREQLEEIKILLSSKSKPLAYARILQLQETSAAESSALETLADSSDAILSVAVADIHDNDEEIAAQALKCLGFMIYHPTVVASIGGGCADAIIESLVKVITTTKIKSVCNLGVWCISVQQLSSSVLAPHLQSLLRSITHALDNPIGSLSITFEAMQAVEKLACTLTEHMRSMASLWAPPIYRRLVSLDKRDRDISERCLLKIMPIICPPPITLAKALAQDMKKKLLLAMKELLDQGMKIQCLQAWGWFIRLLGPYAIKNKHLVNEMLKVLEQTFSDLDSQVQIASLVAWQGLIDVLIEPEVERSLNNYATGDDESNNTQNEVDKHSKRIKLIMEPIVGIMSSKCDVSVRASCLSIWSYLLHKLGSSVGSQSVIKTVWEPIIEVVFQAGPDNKSIWLWNFCLDLFEVLISGRNQETTGNNTMFGKCSLRNYPINCSPWKLCQLNFFIEMISILVNHESNGTVTPDFRRLASDGALRLFGSLMGTVKTSLRCVSTTYDDVIHCLNTIFKFLSNMSENLTTEDKDRSGYCPHTCLKFINVVTERLDSSVLESPLYKVGLESKFVKNLERATEVTCVRLPGIFLMELEDMVLPVVYLSSLYFYVVANSSLKGYEYESLLQQMQGYLKCLLSSYNPQEVLHAFTCFLYKNTVVGSLQIWVVLVNSLKERIDGKTDQSIHKMVRDDIGYSVLLHLLSYPFSSWLCPQINFELEVVVEAWNSVYVCVDQASQSAHLPDKIFSEDFCAILNVCIDQFTLAVDTGIEKEKKCSGGFVLLSGDIIICVLKQLTLSINSNGRHNRNCDARRFNILNKTVLAARFMKLFWANGDKTDPSHLSVASRFLSELVNIVGCLHQKEDVLILTEATSSPLLEWLSEMHILDKNTSYQLQLLWSKMLKALQKSQPSIVFNSSFLKFQQPLLEKALDHPNPAISDATINFWNSTYGARNKLEFPKTLIPVLHKLSINGKINICSGNHYIEDSMQIYKVTNTLKKCSKRVEITDIGNMYLGSKRKRPHELTEHQKEVRRAQQGRTTDCSGHGLGVKTYSALDFSQGNEESQESQDIR